MHVRNVLNAIESGTSDTEFDTVSQSAMQYVRLVSCIAIKIVSLLTRSILSPFRLATTLCLHVPNQFLLTIIESDYNYTDQYQVAFTSPIVSNRVCINILINDDMILEPHESMQVLLSSTSEYVLFQRNSSQVTIVDNDSELGRSAIAGGWIQEFKMGAKPITMPMHYECDFRKNE